ncbi:MAG: DNA (cytosine-5-)-methyltransferase, partial [Deltaproteobacteria bacterium]|nr:DNA (cytosine-5-)-methyltransferase [Deltaproteobacteria bacterium]
DNKKDAKDNIGQTFQSWITLLGGKSVNGEGVLFPHENSVPYHIYWQVLNAKHYGVPQNRERVFIIGIRDDTDNTFNFPKKQHLTKKLKDVLEDNVDEKYFLSEKMVNGLISKTEDSGYINQDTQASQVHSKSKASPTVSAGTHGYAQGYVKVKSATKKDVWIADYRNDEGLRIRKDGISPCMTARRHSEKDISTMPALVGTACNQGVITEPINATYRHAFEGFKGYNDLSPTIKSSEGSGNQILLNKIRRLTPRECFRLMDFPDTFKWTVSDTQAYKQAGNSIVVNVLAEI